MYFRFSPVSFALARLRRARPHAYSASPISDSLRQLSPSAPAVLRESVMIRSVSSVDCNRKGGFLTKGQRPAHTHSREAQSCLAAHNPIANSKQARDPCLLHAFSDAHRLVVSLHVLEKDSLMSPEVNIDLCLRGFRLLTISSCRRVREPAEGVRSPLGASPPFHVEIRVRIRLVFIRHLVCLRQ